MNNSLAFVLGILLVLIIIILVSSLSRSSPTVAAIYEPIACQGVIGT